MQLQKLIKNIYKKLIKIVEKSYFPMLYLIQVKGNKGKQNGKLPHSTKVYSLPHHNKFSLAIDTFYYIHSLEKVNEKSQN